MSQRDIGKLFLLASLVICGCKTHNDSDLLDAGLVGPDGEVVLFYREGGNIVIKQCEDHTVLKTREDCVLKGGTSPSQVDVEKFRSHLTSVLRISDGNYDADTKRKIDLYNKGEQGNVAALEERRSTTLKEVEKIRAFITAYGSDAANSKRKTDLERQLSNVESQINDNRDLSSAIRHINGEINKLIDETITNPAMTTFVYSKEQQGFAFNILKSYVKSVVLSVQFKRVPKGRFSMGSPEGETDRSRDEISHPVTISKDFEMGAMEVTQKQWFSIMGDNPSKFSEKNHCPNEHVVISGTKVCPSLPVENVSWFDINGSFVNYAKMSSPNEISKQEYAALTDKSGWRPRAGFIDIAKEKGFGTFRLPTEAEWEYAARAGTTTPFNLGENISPDKVNYDGNYPYKNAAKGQFREQTVAVGSLHNANSWGLSDMHGNVAEWTADWYGGYPSSVEEVTDPKGPPTGSVRVQRGGSWSNVARVCRSAYRNIGGPGDRYSLVGFRLVRD